MSTQQEENIIRQIKRMNALLPQVESDGGKDIEVIGNTLSIDYKKN